MVTANFVDVGFRSARGPILIALMLSTGLVAIDGTIIATAVPSIVKDVGNPEAFAQSLARLGAGADSAQSR